LLDALVRSALVEVVLVSAKKAGKMLIVDERRSGSSLRGTSIPAAFRLDAHGSQHAVRLA
jgi:hypothetical protein